MSLQDAARSVPALGGAKPAPIPRDVDDRIKRGRKTMLRDAPKRRLCMRFERGDTYWYITEKGMLSFQPTTTVATGGGKPAHRVRNKYNFIRPIIQAKVSAATQRVPSYDVAPSTTDPTDEGAARLAEAVALYGYDKWRLRGITQKVCTLAIGHGGDGFALPYFDPDVGPYHEVDGEMVGEGELKILTLSGNEVYWEAGVDFLDSRWHAIERARPMEDVKAIPGFIGVPLTPDASISDIPTDSSGRENLVMVTEYYERPCMRYPEGRRMYFANGRTITDYRLVDPAGDPWEPYPLRDSDGTVIDEPVLHRLSYTLDPETDRDFGLTWQLIDLERTVQDAYNKIVEWKNRCLNPQMKAPVGSIISPPDDVPGAIRYYRPIGGLQPEWEQVMPIPDSLFKIIDRALTDMRALAADVNLDAANGDAARTLEQIIEQSANRWQSFLGDLAEWHSRLMRHCLLLVARHYTEPRLLQIKGRFGPYPISDFRGAHLMGQVNVTVLPGSLETKTRQQITNQVLAFADRGWVSPQAAMAAIQGGNAEKIIEGYELDVARANSIIQKITDGTVMDMPDRTQTDPATGQTMSVPGWMPRDVDTPEVWKHVLADFMKTTAFFQLDPGMQEVANLIYQGVLQVQAAQAQKDAMQQAAIAQGLGMQNAAKPTQAPGMPDQRGIPGQNPGAAPPPAPGS